MRDAAYRVRSTSLCDTRIIQTIARIMARLARTRNSDKRVNDSPTRRERVSSSFQLWRVCAAHSLLTGDAR